MHPVLKFYVKFFTLRDFLFAWYFAKCLKPQINWKFLNQKPNAHTHIGNEYNANTNMSTTEVRKM